MRKWTKEERYRVLKSPEEIRDLHERILKSGYRQSYHIQPVTGLLNDPNGFIHHGDEWHLFYQWCPWGAVHGLKYWYHVVSKDLVTWKNLGVCIRPDTDQDNRGAYSGSAYPTDGKIYLYYTGNHRDDDWTRRPNTCLVKLNDDGTIEKYMDPLFGPNPEYTEHQRDPKILYFADEKRYRILLGAQTKDKRGCILVYGSNHHNRAWEFEGELAVPGFEAFGDMWECPAIERISGKDVLIFCPQHLTLPGRGTSWNHNGYIIGRVDWKNLVFTPEGGFHVLDFGFDSYAAECAATVGNEDHAILTAWMGLPDSSYPVTDEEEWQGCLTLPRELTIRNRRLIQRPLPQLKTLRGREVETASGILPKACELELSFSGEDQTLRLFAKKDGTAGLVIAWDAAAKEISVDRSTMTNRFNTEQGEVRTRILENPLTHMRIFIDSSSVEIFVNEGDAVFSSRVFPTEEEHFFCAEGASHVRAWELTAAVSDDFVV